MHTVATVSAASKHPTMSDQKEEFPVDPNRATGRRHLSTSPFKAADPEPTKSFEVGQRVSHDGEGLGRIHSLEQSRAVVVDFGGGKLLRIAAPFTRLHAL